MKKPNFFIIGAPKCGTTSMASWLAAHPQIYLSPVKEPHFFNFDYGERRFRSLSRYEKLFDQAGKRHAAVGEASVRYLYSHAAVPAILEYVVEPRFLVMVRNPVDMAYSLHEQAIFNGDEDEHDFESAWRLQNVRAYGDRIPYGCADPQLLLYGRICSLGQQIARLYEWVPRDRVLLINLDHVRQDTGREYRRVLSFLNIEDDGRSEFSVENVAKERRFPKFQQWLRLANRSLRALGVPHFRLGLTDYLRQKDFKARARPRMNEELRKELQQYFMHDVILLEALSGWDLSDWKQHAG